MKETIFTNDELYEIERMADYNASMIVVQSADVIHKMSIGGKEAANEFIGKIIDEHLKAHDTLRTISAKCQGERNKSGSQDNM